MKPEDIDFETACLLTGYLECLGPKELTFSGKRLPAIIDLAKLGEVRPPDGYILTLPTSRVVKIEITSFIGSCWNARHYYATIKFEGLSITTPDKPGWSMYVHDVEYGAIAHSVVELHVYNIVSEKNLADGADWEGYKVGDRTHRFSSQEEAIAVAKRCVELRFRNFDGIEIERW